MGPANSAGPHAHGSAPAPESIRLVQISDAHFGRDPNFEFDGVNPRRSLACLIGQIRREEAGMDAILATGDLSHDASPESYIALRETLQPLEAPVFCIPGNHDDPETMQRYLTGGRVVCPQAAQLGDWHLIFLSTYLQGSQGGRLGTRRLAALDAALSAWPQRHALIAMHHPPVPIGSPWMDAMGLEDSEDFFAVLDRHPQVRGVLWGHIHQEVETQRNDVGLWGAPSTCVQFKPGATRYERDDRAAGHRRLILCSDGRIRTRVVRQGSGDAQA
ncbi:MAG: phosphodiesterase [Gammaproteobacteria bacterium]|nr:phosphodiesterase [Gammaproteobacteria bacterium]